MKTHHLHLINERTLCCIGCGLTREQIHIRKHAEKDLDVTKVILCRR